MKTYAQLFVSFLLCLATFGDGYITHIQGQKTISKFSLLPAKDVYRIPDTQSTDSLTWMIWSHPDVFTLRGLDTDMQTRRQLSIPRIASSYEPLYYETALVKDSLIHLCYNLPTTLEISIATLNLSDRSCALKRLPIPGDNEKQESLLKVFVYDGRLCVLKVNKYSGNVLLYTTSDFVTFQQCVIPTDVPLLYIKIDREQGGYLPNMGSIEENTPTANGMKAKMYIENNILTLTLDRKEKAGTHIWQVDLDAMKMIKKDLVLFPEVFPITIVDQFSSYWYKGMLYQTGAKKKDGLYLQETSLGDSISKREVSCLSLEGEIKPFWVTIPWVNDQQRLIYTLHHIPKNLEISLSVFIYELNGSPFLGISAPRPRFVHNGRAGFPIRYYWGQIRQLANYRNGSSLFGHPKMQSPFGRGIYPANAHEKEKKGWGYIVFGQGDHLYFGYGRGKKYQIIRF